MADGSTDSPFFLIWKNPRKAIRKLLQSNPRHLVIPLAFSVGLERLLFLANQQSLGLNYNYAVILSACVALAVVYAFVWLYLFGELLYLIGRLFGGSAPRVHMRAALAWSGAPKLISLIVWIALLVFSPDYAFIKMTEGIPLLFLYLIMIIPGIWSAAVLILTIQEVQNFPIGTAISTWVVFFGSFLFINSLFNRGWLFILTFIA